MKLYHGSSHLFDKFDYNKIGSTFGTTAGYGFYLTDKLDKALGYSTDKGYLYEFEYNDALAKKLSNEKITFSFDELSAIIRKVDEECDILSNSYDVDYMGYERALYDKTSLCMEDINDVEIICGLANETDISEVLKIISNDFKYDYIVNSKLNEIIILSNNNLKLLNIREIDNDLKVSDDLIKFNDSTDNSNSILTCKLIDIEKSFNVNHGVLVVVESKNDNMSTSKKGNTIIREMNHLQQAVNNYDSIIIKNVNSDFSIDL